MAGAARCAAGDTPAPWPIHRHRRHR